MKLVLTVLRYFLILLQRSKSFNIGFLMLSHNNGCKYLRNFNSRYIYIHIYTQHLLILLYQCIINGAAIIANTVAAINAKRNRRSRVIFIYIIIYIQYINI